MIVKEIETNSNHSLYNNHTTINMKLMLQDCTSSSSGWKLSFNCYTSWWSHIFARLDLVLWSVDEWVINQKQQHFQQSQLQPMSLSWHQLLPRWRWLLKKNHGHFDNKLWDHWMVNRINSLRLWFGFYSHPSWLYILAWVFIIQWCRWWSLGKINHIQNES